MESQPWVSAAACLLIVGVLLSKTTARFGVPSLLLFLGVGMLAGSDGIGGIELDDFEIARSFGIVALGFILFSGGLGTQFSCIRSVLVRGMALASVGVTRPRPADNWSTLACQAACWWSSFAARNDRSFPRAAPSDRMRLLCWLSR